MVQPCAALVFALTPTYIPNQPASIEPTQPIKYANACSQFNVPGFVILGSKNNITKKSTPTKIPRTLYWTFKYVLAPSSIYPATSCILSLPGSSFKTKNLKYTARPIEIIPAISATIKIIGTSIFLHFLFVFI
ncbi:hypothetical protein ES708_18394 [subsurface metagenome]